MRFGTLLLRRAGQAASALDTDRSRDLVRARPPWLPSVLPRSDWDYAVGAGLRMLTLRHMVDESAGMFVMRADEAPLLRYYANSIAHLLEVSVTSSSP